MKIAAEEHKTAATTGEYATAVTAEAEAGGERDRGEHGHEIFEEERAGGRKERGAFLSRKRKRESGMDDRSEEDDGEERRSPSAAPFKWPTVDGPLGPFGEESVACARRYYMLGFALLPFLWALNCCYFWPVLRSNGPSDPSYYLRIRHYVVRSAIGFAIFSVLLTSWSLTFMLGGERHFGSSWNKLVMYNLADDLGLTGWS